MKRSMQEIVELLVFALIALLVGTGIVWLVGWVLGLAGTVLTWLAALVWSLLRFLVPIALVAAAVYALVRLMNRTDREDQGGRVDRTAPAPGTTPPAGTPPAGTPRGTDAPAGTTGPAGETGSVVPDPAHTGATGTAPQEATPADGPGADRSGADRSGAESTSGVSTPRTSAPGVDADASEPVTPPRDVSTSRSEASPGDVADADPSAAEAPAHDVPQPERRPDPRTEPRSPGHLPEEGPPPETPVPGTRSPTPGDHGDHGRDGEGAPEDDEERSS